MAPRQPAGAAGIQRSPVQLRLLDAFALELDGQPVDLPHGTQRLLAFLALRPHPLGRSFLAGSLWLDASDARASANLRSALWRVPDARTPIVLRARGTLCLDETVWVDVHEAMDVAQRWLTNRATARDTAAASLLGADLLPDWYDEWVTDQRERFRQLRLHALEAMAERLIDMGLVGDALLAALAAATDDPLRESAHRALIKVHLAEGNTGEAIRQLRRCEALFARELGMRPSAQLTSLIPQLSATTG